MRTPEQEEALSAVRNVTEALGTTGDEVRQLRELVSRSRRQIRALHTAWALLAVIVASVALWVAFSNHANQLASCRAANGSRAEQAGVWDFILTVSARAPHPPGMTPAQRRQQVTELRAVHDRVHQALAPRDCAATYRFLG